MDDAGSRNQPHVSIDEQVRLAVMNYQHLPSAPLSATTTSATRYLATPDRLAYALGWIVANQIVQQRYAGSAIDALPIYNPERGWDRFLLTRRVTGRVFKQKLADEFGQIRLTGTDAPRLVSPEGKTLLRLGQALRDAPDDAIAAVLEHIPAPYINTNRSNQIAQREQAPQYPLYYDSVTQLILDHPGLVVAREIYIDDREVDGQQHALHRYGAEVKPDTQHETRLVGMTWDWFQLQTAEYIAFFDKRGARAVYRTGQHTWSRVQRQLNEEPDTRVRKRMAGWLRLDGEHPDPAVD
jgi:hypothetical protein